MKFAYTLFTFLLFFSPFIIIYAQDADSEEETSQAIPNLPDLFGYQDYDLHIFKVNLLDIWQYADQSAVVGKIQFAYERKLKPSWSLNTEISANYAFLKRELGNANLKLRDGIISLSLEARYYLGMRRRMFFKQSKNNFSANYLSLAVSTRLIELNRGFTATDNSRLLYSDNFGIAPLFGVQRRILKRIFIDFNLGMRFSYGDPLRTRLFFPKDSETVWQLSPYTTLKLGVAI